MTNHFDIVSDILGPGFLDEVKSAERVMADGEVVDLVDIYYRRDADISPEVMERIVNALWAFNLDKSRDAFPIVNFVVSDERPKVFAAE